MLDGLPVAALLGQVNNMNTCSCRFGYPIDFSNPTESLREKNRPSPSDSEILSRAFEDNLSSLRFTKMPQVGPLFKLRFLIDFEHVIQAPHSLQEPHVEYVPRTTEA